MSNHHVFAGGDAGQWRVLSISQLKGETLPSASYVDVTAADVGMNGSTASWLLRGAMSNVRYATRHELTGLRQRQAALNRPGAPLAALIPIKKSQGWWDLAQDERRAVFEEQSHHTAIGMAYLPAIARQLYHCRDLDEPFDFLTWFEYAPEHAADFDRLLERLRSTLEWTFVEREVDIRLERV